MRTTVDLDTNLLKRLRIEARRRGVTVKELLATLLRRGLSEGGASAPPRYHCPTFHMGVPHHGADLDRALGLATGLEDDEIVRKLALRK